MASLSAAAAGSVGISRLGTSSRSMRSNCTEECNIAGFNAAAGAASCASSTDDGFVLHSRLGETHQQMLYEQRIPWGDLGNDEEQEQVRDAAVSYRLPAAEQLLATAALESADWYEERLLEVGGMGGSTGTLAPADAAGWIQMHHSVRLAHTKEVVLSHIHDATGRTVPQQPLRV